MIVLIGSEKGGTGKTTIASNFAVMSAAAGKETLLVDADKQNSATLWSAIRNSAGLNPNFACINKMGPSTGLDIAKMKDKYEVIIVDAGGRDSLELRTVMMIADQMVVPVKPSQFDVWTLTNVEQLVYDARSRGNESLSPIVCFNLTSPNPALHEAEEAADYLQEFELLRPALKPIVDRVAFRRAARNGCAVIELTEGDSSKAVAEITSLYDQIFQ